MTEHYELAYIVPIKFLDADLEKVREKVMGILKAEEVKITYDDIFAKQKLAYEIDNVYQGTYVVVEFDGESECIKRIDTLLRLMPEVLRHLIIIKKVKTEEDIKREEKIQEKLRQEKENELEEVEKGVKNKAKKEVAPDKMPKVEKQEEEKVEEKKEEEDTKKDDVMSTPKEKATLDDLDKKLDEILTEDII